MDAQTPELDSPGTTSTTNTLWEVENRQRSGWVLATYSVGSAMVALWPILSQLLGLETPLQLSQTLPLVGLAMSLFLAAKLALAKLGVRSRAYHVLSALDGFAQFAALTTLIYLSGSAASPLWAASVISGLRWTQSLFKGPSVGMAQLLLSHLPLMIAFTVAGQWVDAVFALSAMLTTATVQAATRASVTNTIRFTAERLRSEQAIVVETMRQEKNRLARELHDGVAGDITALVFQLRRAAVRDEDEKAAELELKTQQILNDLRSVVLGLRAETRSATDA